MSTLWSFIRSRIGASAQKIFGYLVGLDRKKITAHWAAFQTRRDKDAITIDFQEKKTATHPLPDFPYDRACCSPEHGTVHFLRKNVPEDPLRWVFHVQIPLRFVRSVMYFLVLKARQYGVRWTEQALFGTRAEDVALLWERLYEKYSESPGLVADIRFLLEYHQETFHCRKGAPFTIRHTQMELAGLLIRCSETPDDFMGFQDMIAQNRAWHASQGSQRKQKQKKARMLENMETTAVFPLYIDEENVGETVVLIEVRILAEILLAATRHQRQEQYFVYNEPARGTKQTQASRRLSLSDLLSIG